MSVVDKRPLDTLDCRSEPGGGVTGSRGRGARNGGGNIVTSGAGNNNNNNNNGGGHGQFRAYHNRRNSIAIPDRMYLLYRRFQPPGSEEEYHTSGNLSTTKLVISRVLDAMIFTSAMAITAYNYCTGTLDAPPAAVQITPPPQNNTHINPKKKPSLEIQTPADTEDDVKRRRTQQWAETVSEHSTRTKLEKAVQHRKSQQLPQRLDINQKTKRDKRRTKSMPSNTLSGTQLRLLTEQETDETMARLEETVQSLIQQGQEALGSTVKLYEMDDNERNMRKAFAKQQSI
ncbi:hypothetical protein J3Q64DRAFT_1822674 [Phycomyces blakesleeanus]|uniref:Uncharacterized protein n=2 Tax=Phycomyces blakesleeanus TaxID=4837 RepID=A0A167MRN3_PHYB8|nr:hypothetical protein PHYBLDRAFT_168129 [Phycomyces blakesleeanus NRRL 1555(-)]OAD73694.1 hypothetical protein PHYBLDRAFT_168129 [Phycomyces blakesleeanus NRRL 1555(-)]|eukprot:XP_018291734.1 hypothetical protein PHYBLDRAFT_168129 [Phycomyces blakesleeanus NRRL 1555(-)]